MLTSHTLPKKSSIILAIFLFLADQITKFLVLKNIAYGENVVIAPCLNFALTFNAGVTFGLLKAHSNLHLILLVMGVCLVSCFVIVWWYKSENMLQRFATSMILAGAMGNLVDRLRFHKVVDFIDFHLMGYHWYTFNVADASIVLGVGLLLLDSFFYAKKS